MTMHHFPHESLHKQSKETETLIEWTLNGIKALCKGLHKENLQDENNWGSWKIGIDILQSRTCTGQGVPKRCSTKKKSYWSVSLSKISAKLEFIRKNQSGFTKYESVKILEFDLQHPILPSMYHCLILQAQLTSTKPIFMEEPISLRESAFMMSSFHDATTEPQGVSEVDSPPYEHIRSFEDHITQVGHIKTVVLDPGL